MTPASGHADASILRADAHVDAAISSSSKSVEARLRLTHFRPVGSTSIHRRSWFACNDLLWFELFGHGESDHSNRTHGTAA